MTTATNNRQRVERALRDLAKPSDRFWLRNYKKNVTYRNTIIGDGTVSGGMTEAELEKLEAFVLGVKQKMKDE